MRNEYSAATGPSNISGLTLQTIWLVDADSSYDIDAQVSRDALKQRRAGGAGWIALRTLEGAGRLYLSEDRVLESSANTLTVLDWSSLQRYHTKSKRWLFWWFEFLGSNPLHGPTNRVLQVAPHPRDSTDLTEMYRLLHAESNEQRRLASALFNMMLYRWLEAWHGEWAVTQHQRAVWHVVELMHQQIEKPWSIVDLAGEAGMSVRTFGETFQQVIGMTPKQFSIRLRLDMAGELLQLGLYSVKEVADRFCFSSPYHFSNAFAKHSGIRPSALIPRKGTPSKLESLP